MQLAHGDDGAQAAPPAAPAALPDSEPAVPAAPAHYLPSQELPIGEWRLVPPPHAVPAVPSAPAARRNAPPRLRRTSSAPAKLPVEERETAHPFDAGAEEEKEPADPFERPPMLRIASWNWQNGACLKETGQGSQHGAARLFACGDAETGIAPRDAIVLQEVQKLGQNEVREFREILNCVCRSEGLEQFVVHFSEMSGKHSDDKSKKECHALLLRAPLILMKSAVIREVFNQGGGAVRLDHAPGVFVLCDPRFQVQGTYHRFALASVHMPPPGEGEGPRARRAGLGPQQVRALLQGYAEFALACGLPFNETADARRDPVTHVLCGDWNRVPADQLGPIGDRPGELVDFGWLEAAHNCVTSSGKEPYDHFIYNKNAKRHFSARARVVWLTNRATRRTGRGYTGEAAAGASDHHPIFLDLEAIPAHAKP